MTVRITSIVEGGRTVIRVEGQLTAIDTSILETTSRSGGFPQRLDLSGPRSPRCSILRSTTSPKSVWPNPTAFVKDFKPLRLGTLHLEKGRGTLRLGVLDIKGSRVIDVHSLELNRR